VLTDLRRLDSGFAKEVDLCIIGGGAAGIAIAQNLVGLGIQVCLVESGGFDYENETQQLYAGTSIGQPVELLAGRVRSFGGSTNHWGGRCAELSPTEVARRPWIPDSGWPLGLDELEPYYRRARTVCGLEADWASVDDVLQKLNASTLDDFTSAATTYVWRFAPSDGGLFWNFGKAYYDVIRRASNINLLVHANLTKFETNADGRHVTGVTVRSLSGVIGKISAKHYVLCCSGIENARLLLVGNDHAPAGLGNTHDVVGRYFMEHPRAVAATLFTNDRLSTLQDVFNEFTGPDGVRYQVGLALSQRAQWEGELLNCSAVFEYHGDPEAGTTAAREIWRSLRDGEWPSDIAADAWRVARDIHSVEPNLERLFLHGRPSLLPLQFAAIIVDIEQAPNRESRIYLGTKRDVLGVREAVVDWRLSDLERQTVRRFMLELGADFARRGVGRLRLEPWVDAPDGSWKNGVYEAFHYIGSTRMSPDPRHGVVDVDCGVHGMDNLFVAGSSVFPTSGHVNPTLTIVALALRLADHLKRRMAA
jgi:choline dehydrogenase-like flavoprotein